MKKWIPRLIGTWLNALAIVLPRLAGKKGFYLFCTARPAPLKEHHLAFFATAEKYSFTHEGNLIQTYRWGTGPKKILFLHGWQSHSFRWKKYIDAFSKDEFTLYAMDAPAHGLSGGKYINLPKYTAAVTRFIDHAGPMDIVIAHSFGGFAILYGFYLNPQLAVYRLILMGVPGEVTDFMRRYREVLGLTSRTMRCVLDYFKAYIHHPPGFFSSPLFAAAVPVPGLIIHDTKDTDAPYKYALQIHGAWRKSELMTTTGIGHNLKSPEVQRRVLAYAREVDVRVLGR